MTTLAVCSYCGGTGWGESDYDPGTFYRCSTCNPKGLGKPQPRTDDPRRMDRLVATRVLGWTPPKYEHPYARGKRAWVRPKPDGASSRNACYVDLPHFTEDIATAFEVVTIFPDVVIVRQGNEWRVRIGVHVCWHESLPIAICRAALAAVEAPV